MGKRLVTYFVLLLLVPGLLQPIGAYDTGPVGNNLIEIETSIPVNIHLWDFHKLVSNMTSQVPLGMVQEAYYPQKPEIAQLQVVMNGKFHGLMNNLDVNIISHSTEEFDIVYDIVETGATDNVLGVNPLNETDIILGTRITIDTLKSAFSTHNSDSAYDIHMTNFSRLDSKSGNLHWFNIGDTISIGGTNEDMRNVMDLQSRAVVFDPTAIAPYFGYTVDRRQDGSYLESVIDDTIDILEEVVVGSPMSYWFTPIEREIHVAKIAIGIDGTDIEFNLLSDSNSYSRMNTQVLRLFPGYDVVTSTISVDLAVDTPALYDFWAGEEVLIGGNPSIVVDTNFAETFKNEVRKLYEKFPQRYYMGLFLFADNERDYLIETEDQGYQPYFATEVGFTMDVVDEFYDLPLSQISDGFITSRVLQLMGKNFGLPLYSTNTTRQIDSVMTDYGVSALWNKAYTQFEVDSVQRRNAAGLRTQLLDSIDNQIRVVDNSIVPGYKTDNLLSLRDRVEAAALLENQLNYSEALEEYHTLFDGYDKELENIENSKNAVNYGAVIGALVLVLAYYSKILNEDSFSKEEFKLRIEALRRFNKEMDADVTIMDPVERAKKPDRSDKN